MDPSSSELFHCSVPGCERKFKRKEHLVRHSKSHSSSRPFSCETCGKSFARSDVLRRHVRQHEDKDLNPPAQPSNACDFCHTRKARCDGSTPCRACAHKGLPCTRNRVVSRHKLTKATQDPYLQAENSSGEREQTMLAPQVRPTSNPAIEPDGYEISPPPMRTNDNDYNVLQSLFSPDTLRWRSFDSSKRGPEPSPYTASSSTATASQPPALTETPSANHQWPPTPSLPTNPEMITQPSSDRSPAAQATAQAPAPRNPELPPHQPDQTHRSPNTTKEPATQPNDEYLPFKIESIVPHAYRIAYFKNFHPQWPILDPSSYSLLNWGPELIWTITMLGARFTYTEEGKVVSDLIHEEMLELFDPPQDASNHNSSNNNKSQEEGTQDPTTSTNRNPGRKESESKALPLPLHLSPRRTSLVTLQAGLLNVIFAIYFGRRAAHIARARRVLRSVSNTAAEVGRHRQRQPPEGKAWEEKGWMWLRRACGDVEAFFEAGKGGGDDGDDDERVARSLERKLGLRRSAWEGETWEVERG